MVWDLILKWAIPFLCGGVITFIIDFVRNRHKRRGALEEGLLSLLRGEILHAHDKYVGAGFCPVYAREALTKIYTSYHTLGGNDVATSLYEHVMRLPSRKEEAK